MANFKTHAVVGFSVGVGLNVAKQWAAKTISPTREFDWSEMLTWGSVGVAVASLPDWIEPASSPKHRAFFHSLSLFGLIIFCMRGKHRQHLSENAKRGVDLLGCSYLSHLVLDLLTPMGLPT